LVSNDQAAQLEALLKKLNPKAKIARSQFGKVDLNMLLNTFTFDMTEAERMPGWYQELQGNHVPETLEYNISSFVFRAQKPFHPDRLDKLLQAGLENVIRSKGLLWVAGLHSCAMVWGHAGECVHIEEGSPWLHGSVDIADWPADTPEEHKNAKYGDRRQELVFIGQNLNEAGIRNSLNEALVTDDEFEKGPDAWASWENPFRTVAEEEDTEECAADTPIVAQSSEDNENVKDDRSSMPVGAAIVGDADMRTNASSGPKRVVTFGSSTSLSDSIRKKHRSFA